MKESLLVLATILIWGIVWWYLAKTWRRRGRGAFISHLSGGIVGFVVSAIFFGVLVPEKGATSKASVSDSPTAPLAVRHNVPASDSSAAQPESPQVAATAMIGASSSSEAKSGDALDVGESGDLGMTPDQYAARFDKLVRTIDLPFRVRFANKLHGDSADTVRADLDERMGLIGRVSKKSGNLIGIMFLAGSDGTADTASNISLVAAVALTSAIPDATLKSVTPKIADMVTEYKEGEKAQERVLNGVRLYYLRGDQIGHWFGAEPS